jgi:NADH:ubiquinone oxidoreductase subunit 4 (subunit M)
MLLGIVLLTIYFAFARELSLGGQIAAISGLLLYFFFPVSLIPSLLSGWGGVAIALAGAAAFVAYHSTGRESRSREEPEGLRKRA